MLGFQICHSKKDSQGSPGETPDGPGPIFLFETCLRKIWFSPEGPLAGPGLLHGSAAYQFVLEVISGLHSPIFGETEILGQFKTFLETHRGNSEFGFFQPWGQGLLEDVKKLRTDFLQGQGQHSYGSLLRKRLQPGEKIWILGAGQLTEALLPWLTEQTVTLWVRRPEKAREKFTGLSLGTLSETPPPDATVLIAAPLTENELAPYLTRSQGPWIDLREKSISTQSRAARLTLTDLYREISVGEESRTELRGRVLTTIEAMALERSLRAWFRPQGWEDVCAS